MKKKVSISWSGGKDSAFSLYKILLGGEYDVVSLHTVFNAETKRVGMHGVHETLIEKQAEVLKIPLEKLYLDPSENHDAYTSLVKNHYNKCFSHGIEAIVFGDIFLEDLKKFRDDLLIAAGLTGIYPLWLIDSKILIHDFLNLGFKTLICAANANYFSKTAMGQTIDFDFIKSLPAAVDPCGENGEFHTFVYDGVRSLTVREFRKKKKLLFGFASSVFNCLMIVSQQLGCRCVWGNFLFVNGG